jgi:hypothetical protein
MRHSVAAALLLASCSQTQIVTPRQTNGCAIAAKGTGTRRKVDDNEFQ